MDVPDRVRWAVDLLDVQPRDRILEIGCGPGVAAALVSEGLDAGRIVAIDRSATAIERARSRNAEHLAAGRLVLHQAALAAVATSPDQFDKAFAVNVNLFWTTGADAECRVLAQVLRPGGVLHLVYDGPSPATAGGVAPVVAANLERHGFRTTVAARDPGGMVCVSASLAN